MGSISFLIPKDYDQSDQIELAYKNLGYSEFFLDKDFETEAELLELKKDIDSNEIEIILKEAYETIINNRRHIEILFGTDFDKISEIKEIGKYWKLLITMPKTKELDSAGFNYKLTDDHFGPHIKVEQREDKTILRIKEDTYKKLFILAKEKIKEALEDV